MNTQTQPIPDANVIANTVEDIDAFLKTRCTARIHRMYRSFMRETTAEIIRWGEKDHHIGVSLIKTVPGEGLMTFSGEPIGGYVLTVVMYPKAINQIVDAGQREQAMLDQGHVYQAGFRLDLNDEIWSFMPLRRPS